MADVITLLNKVKLGLGITGEYLDGTLELYIDEVVAYLISAGVSETKARDISAAGVIVRGVADLWNYGSGKGELSPYFYQRAAQLVYESKYSGEAV